MIVLTRQNFKECIAATIRERGLKYYRDGNVVDVYHPDDHTWTAAVEGTEMYDVEIVETDTNGALECSCTCPYEYGEHCKHVAAVLFAIEAEVEEAEPDKGRKRAPSRLEQLRAMLKNASCEQLIQVVIEKAKTDRQFAASLLLIFGKDRASEEDFLHMIDDLLKANRDRDGYIDYPGAITAGRQLEKLIKHAASLAKQKNVDRAILIFQALIQKAGEASAQADDSAGSLGGIVASAIEALEALAPDATPDQRELVFSFLLEQVREPYHRGEDAQWDMLRLAGALVQTDERQTRLFEALDSLSRPDERYGLLSTFAEMMAQHIKLDVIRRRQGEAAADAYIESNVQDDDFREEVIRRRIADGKYDEAQRLVEEALAHYEKTAYGGIVAHYRSILINVAQRKGDTHSVVMLARREFLEHGNQDSLAALKAAIPATSWPKERDSLIKALERDRPHWLTRFLVGEGLWDAVVARAKTEGMHEVTPYLDELDKRVPDQMAPLYEAQAVAAMKYATSRPEYHHICALLKRAKTLGDGARVAELVASFRAQFPKRRALLEELSRV
jgi:hypothetical protein